MGDEYKGARHGRFGGLGGKSAFWGGALLPYLEDDLGPHPRGWHQGWHLPASALQDTLPEAEARFGLHPDSYESAGNTAWLTGFTERRPKWPRFRNRNTAHLFANAVQSKRSLAVWTYATVTEICLTDGRATGAVARNVHGNVLRAHADTVVIACGAIETTRHLLLLDRSNPGLFPQDGPLGRGFHDHLSAPIADLEVADARAITRQFGFQFVPGGLRNTRFELSPEARAKDRLAAAFLHIAFTRAETSGFEALRRLLQAL